MMLTPEDIAEYKAMWKEEFGEELTDGEASEQARRLLTLFEVIYRKLPDEK